MAIPTAPSMTVNDTLPSRRKTKFGIGNPIWAMRSLAGLYSDLPGAVAREYTTNAADEHIKHNVSRPVEVTLPSAMNPFFTVRDYAYGMNEDVMHEIYTQFGVSTKHDSNATNGMLGLGSKSAVAYTTQFTVTSVCEGIKTIVSINREPDYSIDLDTIHMAPTDDPSGTEVKIPVHNISEFNHKAMDIYRFWTPGTLLINSDEVVPQLGDKLVDNLFMATGEKSYVVMGNVGYPINNPLALFAKVGMSNIPFIAFVDNGDVEFVPSREALAYDGPNTVNTLERIVKDFSVKVKAKAQADIDSAKNHYDAYLAWTNWTARLGYGVLKDLSYKGDALTSEIKFRAKVFQTRGYGRSVYSVDEWPIDRLKNTILVTDYTMSLGTPHKVKIKDWVRSKGLSTTYYLFVGGKVDSPWIDPTRTVSWDQVVIDIPNQKGGGNGGVKRIKGTFDYQTVNGFETEKAIPVGKDVYYIRTQDEKAWDVRKILTTLGWTNAAVVVLAANRTVKFARDNPSAKDFIVEAQKMVNHNPASLIPDYIKPAMAIDHATANWLRVLDVNKILDPAWADLKNAVNAKRDGKVMEPYNKALALANLCHLGYTVKQYSASGYTDLTKDYPLLNHMSTYTSPHQDIYLYMNLKYSQKETNMAFPSKVITGTGGVNSVSAYDVSTGQFYMADQNHPHYEAILAGLTSENPEVWGLFDVATGVVSRLQNITDRISWDGANIRFDGDPIHSVLASQLQRAMEQGESNLEALALFWEKLSTNPNEHSREQAYAWLATHDFKITGEGDIVAYKGVRFSNYATPSGGYASISSGTAFVDGEKHTGYIPNAIGSVVTMPRSEVAHDPAVACHYGLHAGDWSYASDFAQGAVLEVHINPRDIVSVPIDCGARKVRTCKYTVVNVVESEYTGGPVLKPDAVASSWTPDVSYAG